MTLYENSSNISLAACCCSGGLVEALFNSSNIAVHANCQSIEHVIAGMITPPQLVIFIIVVGKPVGI